MDCPRLERDTDIWRRYIGNHAVENPPSVIGPGRAAVSFELLRSRNFHLRAPFGRRAQFGESADESRRRDV